MLAITQIAFNWLLTTARNENKILTDKTIVLARLMAIMGNQKRLCN